jgi:hypothetical protein
MFVQVTTSKQEIVMKSLTWIRATSKICTFGVACFATWGLAAVAAEPELVHRYSFKDGKADDSVGKVNGKLMGDAKIADGKLVLDNTGKASNDEKLSYLSFRESILPKSGSATLEVWFQSKSDGQFARVFDFGRRGQGYLFLTVNDGDSGRVAITNNDWGEETKISTDDKVNDNKLHMAAAVIDAKEGKFHLYIDGHEIGTGESLGENTLDKIKGTDFWLGRSLFETDAGFTGSINELRVFNSALTGEQIAAHGKAGAATLQTPK